MTTVYRIKIYLIETVCSTANVVILQLALVYDTNSFSGQLTTVSQVKHFRYLVQSIELCCFNLNSCLADQIQHILALRLTSHETSFDSDISENDLLERNVDDLWLTDLNHVTVHLRDCTRQRCSSLVLGDVDCRIDALSTREFLDLLDNLVFSLASIEDVICAGFLAHVKSDITSIDCYNLELLGLGHLDPEMTETATCTDDGDCIAFLCFCHDDSTVDCDAGAC